MHTHAAARVTAHVADIARRHAADGADGNRALSAVTLRARRAGCRADPAARVATNLAIGAPRSATGSRQWPRRLRRGFRGRHGSRRWSRRARRRSERRARILSASRDRSRARCRRRCHGGRRSWRRRRKCDRRRLGSLREGRCVDVGRVGRLDDIRVSLGLVAPRQLAFRPPFAECEREPGDRHQEDRRRYDPTEIGSHVRRRHPRDAHARLRCKSWSRATRARNAVLL